MMRTIEIFLVIMIITAAFVISSIFAVLPSPRQVSPLNLRRLALTTLQSLDVNYDLSKTVFKPLDDPAWDQLQIALSAILPPNMVYNLTVYEIWGNETRLYHPINSLSNAQNLGLGTDASSYLATSSNVTFNSIPEKIGEHGGGGTLYILNCTDANGWWITGYTAQKLAKDLQSLLSPYFQQTIMVQNTTQLAKILDGLALQGEPLQNAVVINTFGEAVPIPSSYADMYSGDTYARYFYELGRRVHTYNWTWASIVGWPFYYVTNTNKFSSNQNGWGIYGMIQVGKPGLQAFLQGLDNQQYVKGDSQTGSLSDPVYLSSDALYYANYYGIYPSSYQTCTRALPTSITSTYDLTISTQIIDTVGSWNPGAVYRHNISGALLALGLARTPDIRLTALGLLCDYKPRLYRSDYSAAGTSRFIVLQIGQTGGI